VATSADEYGVIVNPQSGGGRGAKRWPALEERLRREVDLRSVAFTQAPRDAGRLACELVDSGCQRIVVAGGDGTCGEVVDGLIAGGFAEKCALALLPLGSGGDFARHLGLRSFDAAFDVFHNGVEHHVDAGCYRASDEHGRDQRRFFANEASFGLSADVVACVKSSTKALGGTAAFGIGALRAIAKFHTRPMRIEVDGDLLCEGPMCLVACANGAYFGGGMKIAPEARCDDGLFEVVVGGDLSKPALLSLFSQIYSGAHVAHPKVTVARGKAMRLTPLADLGDAKIESDGELGHAIPAEFEVMPRALRVLVPRAFAHASE